MIDFGPQHTLGALSPTAGLIASIIKIVVVFSLVMVIVALLTLLERKISAWMQDRMGPNRVGPGGLLQPAADGLKNILKEETHPGEAHRIFFIMAPMMAIIPALILVAVIPLAAPLYIPGVGVIPMVIADVPVGILFILAFSSLGVYGIVIAGWASANKYALLGAMRAGAQMISYEIALGMSLLSVFFVVGNVRLTEIIAYQQAGWWFAFPLAASFFLFWVSAFAETNRLPFDLPEAESELVTGYHTEYSSMKFSMFFIAEYAHVLTVSMVMATVFLGGWDIPFWTGDNIRYLGNGVVEGAQPAWWITLLTMISFAVKTLFFILVFMLVRWTVPRFRYDQVMDLGWKFMLPVALATVVVTAATVLALDVAGVPYGWMYALVLTVVNVILLAIGVFFLDRGRILEGSAAMAERRASAAAAARFHEQQHEPRRPATAER
jgi:NADH-quinone oxidoreductase subunit H